MKSSITVAYVDNVFQRHEKLPNLTQYLNKMFKGEESAPTKQSIFDALSSAFKAGKNKK